MSTRLLAAVALVMTLSATAAPAQSARGWTLGLRSFGPYRYGATLAEAEAASGSRLRLSESTEDRYDGACARVDLPGQNAGLLFTWDGRWVLRHVTVSGWEDAPSGGYVLSRQGRPRTRSGVGVGSTEAAVFGAYPGQIRRRTESHAESAQESLVFTPREASDREFSVVFRMHEGAVSTIVAGYDEWASDDACL